MFMWEKWSIYQYSLSDVDSPEVLPFFLMEHLLTLCSLHLLYLPYISCMGTSHSTFNKMAHNHTATGTLEAASMEAYHVSG
jgi:hypothetical protein